MYTEQTQFIYLIGVEAFQLLNISAPKSFVYGLKRTFDRLT